ncbi:hypothetical protein H632_c2897p0 [Helicosporidium sp. ATCC 50920]|nr:hypothetical protein H632_c2897p0 [Helicosporidium sp. ATCC 50920]|eukprot:KDD72787.1 hypothetical protein H632_c2897p0 [Helicosporidium sp. ATCC 50920]
MQLAPGCSADDIFVSRLYMSGTCVQSRDNTESSSCSGQTPVVVVSSGSGFAVPANSTSAVCNQVFGSSSPRGAFMSLSAAAGSAFDSATLCAETSAGYFFLLNNCTGSARSLVPLNVNVQAYSGSCNGRSSWFGGGLSGWAIAVIIVSLGALVLAFGGCWWRRRRFAMGGSPAAVSMAQVNSPPPPPPAAGTYGSHVPPYSPSGYERYPPYTPSAGVYLDGRPVNPPPPDESGVAMGYPKV